MDRTTIDRLEKTQRDANTYGLPFGDFVEAAERGRSMTALMLRDNPIERVRAELAVGVEYCRQRYPEAYQGELS
jgi:hypothetical protein